MRLLLSTLALAVCASASDSVHNFDLKTIDGAKLPLASYKGKVLMIVNTASQCGFTPQYKGLEAAYKKYKDRGFVMLGVPANNFGGQEPGTNEEIKTFCSRTYSVSFPMTSKISVKGQDQDPLYQFLSKSGGGDPQWNFTKYLVGKDGNVIKKFASNVDPGSAEFSAAIEAALQ